MRENAGKEKMLGVNSDEEVGGKCEDHVDRGVTDDQEVHPPNGEARDM